MHHAMVAKFLLPFSVFENHLAFIIILRGLHLRIAALWNLNNDHAATRELMVVVRFWFHRIEFYHPPIYSTATAVMVEIPSIRPSAGPRSCWIVLICFVASKRGFRFSFGSACAYVGSFLVAWLFRFLCCSRCNCSWEDHHWNDLWCVEWQPSHHDCFNNSMHNVFGVDAITEILGLKSASIVCCIWHSKRKTPEVQCCCPQGKSLSSRILEDQFSCPCPCPCPCGGTAAAAPLSFRPS